jgi:hypothetical protein
MATPTVSFRISRSTEGLAETIHALSQRLVTMEQKLEAIERQLNDRRESEPDPREMQSLERVDHLLRDCRELLDAGPLDAGPSPVEEQPPALAGGHQRAEGFAAA